MNSTKKPPATATEAVYGSAPNAASATPKTSSQAAINFDLDPAANLDRVSSRIGAAIVEFCRARVGRNFHVDDLRRHIAARVGTVAPASPDRILRDLRRRGCVNYSVVSRHKSLYRVLEVVA